MEARLSFVTLGVSDLNRAAAFYEKLGFPRIKINADVAFFELGKTWLALYSRALLAEDAGVPNDGRGFSGVTLAHNVRESHGVDETLEEAQRAGARIVKPALDTDWGGRSGYFADPDGHLWEVAWNPKFPHV